LIKGLGEKCWNTYNYGDKSNVISKMDDTKVKDITEYLVNANAPGVKSVVRIPLCATSWLNIVTEKSAAKMAKYPDLGG
jgi:hypothetical protein